MTGRGVDPRALPPLVRDGGHGFDELGASDRWVRAAARLLGPVHDRWFRVRSVGGERVPARGPAILAANHSGGLPWDAAMIWRDLLARPGAPRLVRPIADHFVPRLPFVGTVLARGGVVGGSAGNARALLERGEVVLIFPEGVPGIGKPFAERYRLRPFRVGHVELAIRHRVPVVPTAVVGAEEQMIEVLRIRLGRAAAAPYLPVLLPPLSLPVRYHLLYGEPLDFSAEHAPEAADDPEVLERGAERVRAAVGALLERGLSERRGWFR